MAARLLSFIADLSLNLCPFYLFIYLFIEVVFLSHAEVVEVWFVEALHYGLFYTSTWSDQQYPSQNGQ